MQKAEQARQEQKRDAEAEQPRRTQRHAGRAVPHTGGQKERDMKRRTDDGGAGGKKTPGMAL